MAVKPAPWWMFMAWAIGQALSAGCVQRDPASHQNAAPPPAQAPVAAMADDSAESIKLRHILIEERRAGQRSEAECFRYALEAARQNDARLDTVLIDYYRDRGINVAGDPVVVAFALHQGPPTPYITKASFDGRISSYCVVCSDGPLSGGAFLVKLEWRHGCFMPISDEVAAIY